MLAHVLGVSDPLVEMLQSAGISSLLNFCRAVFHGFFQERDDFRLGLIFRLGSDRSAIADFGAGDVLQQIVVRPGNVQQHLLEAALSGVSL